MSGGWSCRSPSYSLTLNMSGTNLICTCVIVAPTLSSWRCLKRRSLPGHQWNMLWLFLNKHCTCCPWALCRKKAAAYKDMHGEDGEDCLELRIISMIDMMMCNCIPGSCKMFLLFVRMHQDAKIKFQAIAPWLLHEESGFAFASMKKCVHCCIHCWFMSSTIEVYNGPTQWFSAFWLECKKGTC